MLATRSFPRRDNGAPHETRNTFGGSIGGKIIKDKLFFFADAELIRERLGSTGLSTVPTADGPKRRLQRIPRLPSSPVKPCKRRKATSVPVQQNMIFDPTTGDPITGA